MKIIDKYNQKTKEEKKKILIDASKYIAVGAVGCFIGVKLCKKKYTKELEWAHDNLECIESDMHEAEEIIDRQAIKMSAYIDTITDMRDGISERDIALMDIVDGNINRYRALRSVAWDSDELIDNANRLDTESMSAQDTYNKFINKQ